MSKKTASWQGSKPDDPEQYKRFLETAEEVEADDDPKALEKALNKIITVQSPKPD